MARGYPASDLAALAPELSPESADAVARPGAEGPPSPQAGVDDAVALARPSASRTAKGARAPQRVCLGPSSLSAPTVGEVYIRDADDAVFVRAAGEWQRFDVGERKLRAPDGDMARASAKPWSNPPLVPPGTAVRDRIVALVGEEGGQEKVPITLAPRGDAWLYFQAGGLGGGSAREILKVGDRDASRVLACLGRPTDALGPISYWPP